jgi:hypothetical protein
MMPGYCRWCCNPSPDSDRCDRCEAFSDLGETLARNPRVTKRKGWTFPDDCVPYDPETDPF